MSLAFPNPSRSYDEARRGVRFSGHDGMFEISFFVEAAVLAGASRGPLSEQQYLQALEPDSKFAGARQMAMISRTGAERT
jgi:hypothetical protein